MKHIPNALSVFRIVLIPFIVWQIHEENTRNAAILLMISGCTDLIDGKLARRFNWITDIGKVLDPAADKLTQTSISIVLAIKFHEYWFLFALMIVKDIVMLLLSSYLMVKKIHLEGAKWFGKVATFVYYLTMILIVLIPDLNTTLLVTLLSLATLCAVIAALLYIPEFLKCQKMLKVKSEKL